MDASVSSGLKSNMTAAQVVRVAMDIGEKMIICGAEANRVEDTITRICKAYGADRVDVFSITSYISTTITSGEEKATESRRIHSYSNDLDKLEYLNAVSRYICTNLPEYNNIDNEISALKQPTNYPVAVQRLAYVLSTFAFTVFFGGRIKDGLVAGLIAVVAFFIDAVFKRSDVNIIIYDFLVTFAIGIIASLINLTPLIDSLDKVLIGLVMLYIPGVQLTNAVRDILSGDIVSGLLRLIEAVLIAIAIAAGFALSVMLIALAL